MDDKKITDALRLLYELWADQHGQKITLFEVTRREEDNNDLRCASGF